MENLKEKTVLFLEDNLAFAEDTKKFLAHYVKNIVHVTSMKDALEKFESEEIDFILSDLKVEDGIALLFIENIRKINTKVPIVVLSAHKDEAFLLKAIPLGLTAYALKPINFVDFEEVLNKCAITLANQNKNIIFLKDDSFYDKGRKVVIVDKVEVSLTKKEALFVELLYENKSAIVSKEMINERIWENNVMSDPALKNFLLRIRKKTYRDFFYTIQGVGYRLY